MLAWPFDNDVVSPGSTRPLLDALTAATRLLGSQPELVLHGGGNSSVKDTITDVTGESVDVLYMKSSGTSMDQATPESFTALRLARLRHLLPPTVLSDDQFVNEMRAARILADAPDPSLETLVHAVLPHTFVLHSHADVILAITDTAGGEQRIREALGGQVIVLDYAMPGADIGRVAAAAWAAQGSADIIGLVIPRHGLFSMGDTAREAYERHAQLVAAAHEWIAARGGTPLGAPAAPSAPAEVDLVRLARLRRAISDAAGRNMLLRVESDDDTRAFAADPSLRTALRRGPVTPDHVTRTKGEPLELEGANPAGDAEAVAAYVERYHDYVQANANRRARAATSIDPAPRLILEPEIGLITAGNTASQLVVNNDLARHAMQVIRTTESLGGYQPVSPGHVFDLEFFGLQQAKMTRGQADSPLRGQVAIVTGAASGIGRACAQALLDAGCAVVGWDMNPAVTTTFASESYLGIPMDVTNETQVAAGIRSTVETFGGLDILVIGAGIFPTSKNLGEMELDVFRKTMQVNVESVVTLYGLAWPLLEHSRDGGRVVVIASKNVLAPGAGAAAYSSSKAAVTQLSRVAALEWAPKGIRVNLMHPDAVFDTGLWTPELLAARAEHYGLTVEQYKRRNLLHTEVTSAACADLALAMVTGPFRATTGAQVAIDGGSDRTL